MSETHRYALNLCHSRYEVKTRAALNHTVLLCREGRAARHDVRHRRDLNLQLCGRNLGFINLERGNVTLSSQ